MTAVALRMTGADFLKLRKKRGTLIWVLVLALLPVIILFTVKAIQHSSNPLKYEPAGGTAGFTDGLRLLCLFFGPLAAILIGVEAGTGDASAGVFRDLVVTGRSRLALFASRVPAALAVCWSVTLTGYAARAAGHVSRSLPISPRPTAPWSSTGSASRCWPPASCAWSPWASRRSRPQSRPRSPR